MGNSISAAPGQVLYAGRRPGVAGWWLLLLKTRRESEEEKNNNNNSSYDDHGGAREENDDDEALQTAAAVARGRPSSRKNYTGVRLRPNTYTCIIIFTTRNTGFGVDVVCNNTCTYTGRSRRACV